MAKLSLRVFKQGKPIYWIIGAVFVFVVFYLMFNRGSGASGSQVVQTGPSEAMQIAALQAGASQAAVQSAANIEAARIQASREQAALGAQVALAQLASGEKVALEQLALESGLGFANIQANILINDANISYALESARIASETQIGLRQIDVDLLNAQLEAQTHMFEVQSQNLLYQSLIGQTGSLKKKNRDEYAAYLASLMSGQQTAYIPQRSGGFGLGDLFGVVSPLANAIM